MTVKIAFSLGVLLTLVGQFSLITTNYALQLGCAAIENLGGTLYLAAGLVLLAPGCPRHRLLVVPMAYVMAYLAAGWLRPFLLDPFIPPASRPLAAALLLIPLAVTGMAVLGREDETFADESSLPGLPIPDRRRLTGLLLLAAITSTLLGVTAPAWAWPELGSVGSVPWWWILFVAVGTFIPLA
ncbi:hypothetical protein EON81_18030, partial [bacterium]